MIVAALVAAGSSRLDDRRGGLLQSIARPDPAGALVGAIAWIVYNFIAWRTAEYHVTNRRVLGREA